MVRVHTMLTQEGAAKTEREETEDRTLTSRELREETRAIKTLFKGAENNPETVEKIKALVQKSLPKMKKLFGSLEKARRLAEDQQRKEAKAFEDFEKYILEDLVKWMDKKYAEEILKLLVREEQKVEGVIHLQIRDDKRLYHGKKHAGHYLKKHFDTAQKRARAERGKQKEVRAHAGLERQLKLEIRGLAEQMLSVKGIEAKKKLEAEVLAKAKALIKSMSRSFFLLYDFEWDVTEEEAQLLETGRFYLATLRHLEDKGVKDLGGLQGELDALMNAYSRKYLRMDIGESEQLFSFMGHCKEAAIAHMHYLKDMFTTKEWWRKHWKRAILGGGLLRIAADKDFRKFAAEHYPKLVPVLIRIFTTKGASLKNPADLTILYDVLVDKSPNVPDHLKKLLNELKKTTLGKNLVKKGVDKVSQELQQAA